MILTDSRQWGDGEIETTIMVLSTNGPLWQRKSANFAPRYCDLPWETARDYVNTHHSLVGRPVLGDGRRVSDSSIAYCHSMYYARIIQCGRRVNASSVESSVGIAVPEGVKC
jgi:hypothetical protein